MEHVALAGRTVAQVRELLAADASVHAVGEPVRDVRLDHDPPATQAHASHTGGHHNDGAIEQWHLPQPTMTALWNGWNDDTDHQVVVAVLDSGVDFGHPDLAGSIVPDSPGGCHEMDEDGHGTSMAGIIAARRGNGDVAGVAPEAKILSVRRALDSDTCTATPAPVSVSEGVAEAVNRGARVINMSFAGSDRHDDTDVVVGGIGIPSYDTYDLALRAAAMLGVVAVTSAGNCGDDSDVIKKEVTMKDWEWQGCPEHNARERPAIYDDVISVASIDISGSSVASSSVHEHVDVAAPGFAIHTADRCTLNGSPPVRQCGIEVKFGTSPAAAFVSGVVAHMLNRYPQATVGQVRRALELSARDRGAVGRDDEYGHGIVYPAQAIIELRGLVETFKPVGSAGAFRSLSAGARHTCGLRANGAVQCWGYDKVVAETPNVAFKSLSSSPTRDFVCGVRLVDQAVQCWGDVPSEITTDVAGARVLDADGATALDGRFLQVAAGRAHVCGLRPSGRAVCWGDSSLEQTFVPDDVFYHFPTPFVPFVEISAGSDHTCGITTAATLDCWGDDSSDRLLIDAVLGYSDVAAGGSHTCAIGDDGVVSCRGDNSRGQLDAPSGDFIELSAGSDHTCAISASRGLRCWGDSGDMRLDAPADQFRDVAAGGRHACALNLYMGVVCWGDNSHGQAPQQARLNSLSLTAGGIDLLAGRFRPDVTEYTITTSESRATLSASMNADDATRSRICAAYGSVLRCDGLSRSRPVTLADGATITVRVRALFGFGVLRTYRIEIVEPPRLTALSVRVSGSGGGCAPVCPELVLDPVFDPYVFDYSVTVPARVPEVTVDYTTAGGIARVTPQDAAPPPFGGYNPVPGYQLELSTDSDFSAIAAGNFHSCGIKTDASVVCWGDNSSGQADAPAGHFSAIAAGGSHSCGIKTNTGTVCWGSDFDGRADAPAGPFSAIAAGGSHSCGIKTNTGAVCWGYNGSGRADAPAGPFSAIAAGGSHSCGIKTDARAVCWGSDFDGRTDAPAGYFSAIAAGSYHSCGITTDASAVCWGYNSDGRADAPGGSFSAIAAGGSHSCGITTDADAVCWGSNSNGQADAPAGSFSAIAAGYRHSCGIKADDSVVCWGARSAVLEPAASAVVTFVVASSADAALSARYTLAIERPRPVLERAARAAGSRAAGAGPDPLRDQGGRADAECGDAPGCHGLGEECHPALPECGGDTPRSDPRGGDPAERAGSQGAGSGSAADPRPGLAETATTSPEPRAAVVCPVADPAGADVVVDVADAVLRAGINRRLGRAPGAVLTAADMAALTSLEIRAFEDAPRVGSLSGLEHASSLATLDLYGHDVSDLGPLSCLASSLTAVELGGNDITDIAALSGLAGLGVLGLSGNDITDIAALSGLAGLTALDLAENQITALGAVSGLESLVTVNAARNEIASLEPLRGLVGLERLYLYDNQITDLAPLGGLAALTDLYLDHNSIADIAALSALSGLVTLGLGDNDITDVSALSALSSLDALYLFDNDIADAAALAALSDLDVLWIDGNDLAATAALGSLSGLGYLDARHNLIADTAALDALGGTVHSQPQRAVPVQIPDVSLRAAVAAALGKNPSDTITRQELAALERLERAGNRGDTAPVEDLTGLEHAGGLRELSLPNNNIADLSPIAGLGGLETLNLQSNNITSIAALAQLASLRDLNVAYNHITSLTGLPAAAALRTLRLDFNPISDLAPLGAHSGLRTLTLTGTPAGDLAPLAALSDLRTLSHGGSQITDITALASLHKLRRLALTHTSATDLAPLAALTRLDTLHLANNHIEDLAPLAALTRLTVLNLQHNTITDLTPLAGLTRIKNLTLRDNRISDLTALTALAQLTVLDLQDNDITSLEPLTNLTNLRFLHIAGNNITDFAPLQPIANLTTDGQNDQNTPN